MWSWDAKRCYCPNTYGPECSVRSYVFLAGLIILVISCFSKEGKGNICHEPCMILSWVAIILVGTQSSNVCANSGWSNMLLASFVYSGIMWRHVLDLHLMSAASPAIPTVAMRELVCSLTDIFFLYNDSICSLMVWFVFFFCCYCFDSHRAKPGWNITV